MAKRDMSIDAARAVLGHSSPAVTEVYAELDHAKEAQVMADHALFLFDVDAKAGHVDAQRTAEYIQNESVPNAYIEPSRGRVGRHLYLKVNVKYTKRAKVNELLEDVSAALSPYFPYGLVVLVEP